MQIGCTGNHGTHGRIQMYNTGGLHWRCPRNNYIFRVFKARTWPFLGCCDNLSYEFKERLYCLLTLIFTNLWSGHPNYGRLKLIKWCPNGSRIVCACVTSRVAHVFILSHRALLLILRCSVWKIACEHDFARWNH